MSPRSLPRAARLSARFLLLCAALFAFLLLRPAPVSAGVVGCAGSPYTVLTEGELNDAITCVNSAGVGSHEIMLQEDILLTASTPVINNVLATSIVIDGNSLYRVDGQAISGVRPFEIAYNTTVTMQNITISGGRPANAGGGISNAGTLAVINSTISGNSTAYAGGIYNGGTLAVTGSTISGNSAGFGGGIYNFLSRTLNVTNSTISGNIAASQGGGIFNQATLAVTNSTLSGNGATNGGGIYNEDGTLSLNNSIIANSSGGDCTRVIGTLSASHSLIEDGLTCINGTSTNNLSGDPALGALANNGGTTLTHALPIDSPAIDTGSNALAVDAGSSPLTTDQRGAGFARIRVMAVDMGAYEYPLVCATLVATEAELNDAIACFNAETTPATHEITLTAAIDLTASTTIINNATSNVELLIEGGGFTVDGQGTTGVRPFAIAANTTVTMQFITISGGKPTGQGGGINNQGTLTLDNSTIIGNSTSSGGIGGGILNGAGTLVVTGSTISGNSTATYGGGIFNAGTLLVTNSTLSGNAASGGGGGGIYSSSGGQVTFSNSTLSSNSSNSSGGGIYNDGGTLALTNSTLSANGAPSGGGILNSGALSIHNSVIANSTSGAECSRAGGTISASHSLIEDSLVCVNGASSNNLTGDPDLGPLQDNGGPTQTHMPAAASPAAGAADNAVCAADPISGFDQRGVPRPQGAVCDMGAVEITAQAALGGVIDLQGRVAPGTPGLVTLEDTNGIMPAAAVPFDAATGAFSFPSVPVSAPSTPYKLTASHGLYLSNEIIYIVLPAGNVATGSTLLKAGDANNDGTINILDLGCMGGAYQTPGSSCGGLGGTDLNADGVTNIQDLALAGGNYNLISPQPY